jgi:response regulator NasT
MAKLVPDLLDVLVVHEPAWPESPANDEVLGLGMAVLVVVSGERVARFRSLAELYPITFVHEAVDADGLWPALLGAWAARRRHSQAQMQIKQLQQRLRDRIVIERAKGVLVQRLGITEEEAYQRLRVLSRRQRRQIREVAQSLLDTQPLLGPGANGHAPEADPPPVSRCDTDTPIGGLLTTDS